MSKTYIKAPFELRFETESPEKARQVEVAWREHLIAQRANASELRAAKRNPDNQNAALGIMKQAMRNAGVNPYNSIAAFEQVSSTPFNKRRFRTWAVNALPPKDRE